MSTASKFPFQSFDENLCLNCSKQFVKDGVVQTRKLTYMEVVDEGSIVKQEAISVFSALNYIFKLPLSNQIDEVHELTFGCCPGCASVISRLHELHKKLDELSSINSVISNIVNMKMAVERPEEPAITLKAASNSTIQASPAYVLQLSTNMNLTKNCPNCYVKLYSGPINSICPLEERRAVSSAVVIGATQTESRTTITMSDVLNSILNFPERNSMTQNISFCVECAPALLQIFKLYIDLKTRPESYLHFLFGRIQSWISTSLTSSAPVGLSTRIVLMPNSRALNATYPVSATQVPVGPTIVSPNSNPRIRTQDHKTVSKVNVTSESQSQPLEDPLCESPMDVATVSYSDSGESAGDYVSDTHQTVVDAPTRIGILTRPRPIIVDAPNKNVAYGRTDRQGGPIRPFWSKNGRNGRPRRFPFVPVDPVPFLCGPVGTDTKPRSRKQVFDRVIKEPVPVEHTCGPMEVATDNNSDPVAKPPKIHRTRKYTAEQILERKKRYKRRLQFIPRIIHDPCPHCGKVFVNRKRNWMKNHIEFSHKHSITDFGCDTCGRPCRNSTARRKHAKTHLNVAERLQKQQEDPPPTFLCQECGKILMSEITLKYHSRIHEGILTRQLHCPEYGCGFTCCGKITLKRHRSRVHDPAAVPKYKCAKCSQSFRLHIELKEHEMVSCDAHNRPFACDQGNCQRRFKLKQALVMHLNEVHKLRPEKAREKVYPGLDCPVWVGKNKKPKKR